MADRADQDWQERVDRGELLAPVTRRDGTLLVEGIAAREGVLEYRRSDGTVRREFVPASTLRASAANLARVPLTLDHPDPRTYPDGVTPDNVSELVVGDVDGEVVIEDGGFTRVRMAVRRRDAIDAVRSRTKRELSTGYKVRLDSTPGEHPVYGRYDAVQVERVNNHLAIVPRARAGREAGIRTDAAVATEPVTRPTRGVIVNPRIVQLLSLLGITSRVDGDDAALDAAIESVKSRADAGDGESEAKVKAAEARADAAEAELAKVKGELKTALDADAARRDASDRAELARVCAGMGMSVKADADLRTVRRAIAEAHLGKDLPKNRVDDAAYIDAIVDLARERVDGADAGSEPAEGRKVGRAAWQGDAAAEPAKAKKAGKRKNMADRWGGRPAGGGE